MCVFKAPKIPAPAAAAPPPVPQPEEILEEAQRNPFAKMDEARRKTLKTGALGVQQAQTATKTLLGQ